MAKSTNTVRVETWVFNKGTSKQATGVKIAVRNDKGQFNGATNFKGSRIN